MTPGRAAAGESADRRSHPTDPTQLAIDMAAMKGTLALFQSQLATGMANNTSTLQALQAEVRDLSKVTAQVASLLAAMEGHSQGLGRAFGQIGDVARDFREWREQHERDNRGTADTVTTWRGVVIGLSLVGTLLLSAGIYIVESRFSASQTDRTRIEAQMERSHREFDARLDALEAAR